MRTGQIATTSRILSKLLIEKGLCLRSPAVGFRGTGRGRRGYLRLGLRRQRYHTKEDGAGGGAGGCLFSFASSRALFIDETLIAGVGGTTRLLAPIVLFLVVIVLAGCGSQPLNLLVVTLDTTRPDHLGAYGYAKIATPNIDRLASEGVLFTNAFTPVPITLPSHATILTGRYPTGHGVRDNGLFTLPETELTLAEILRNAGYRTAAAVGSFPLIGKFGLHQGFELYDDNVSQQYEDLLGRRRLPKAKLFFDERRAGQVNEAVIPWLEQHAAEPFFVWVHYFDPHQPQLPPPPYNQLYATRPYDGEIAYADECVGTLLDLLRELGVDDRTVVVLTADHGEGLGEHDEVTHALLAYNATLRVPLVLRIPGGPQGRVIRERVATVDIVPSVLELLGVAAPDGLQGRSLVPLLAAGGDRQGAAEYERPLYAETLSPRLNHGWGELRALLLGRYKYIHGPRPELFDLVDDPAELHDLSAVRPEIAGELRDKLAVLAVRLADPRGNSAMSADEETLARLASLGYLHSTGDHSEISESLRNGGTPPQDRVGDINELSMTKNHLVKGQTLAAREGALGLLRRDPGNTYYLELLAQAELRLGRHDEALAALQQIGERQVGQTLPATQLQMGLVLFAGGRQEEGLAMARRAEAARPTAEGQYLLAAMLNGLARSQEYRQALERALELDPFFAPARVDLAILLARQGKNDLAASELERAIRDWPYYAKGHFNYGAFLVTTGRPEAALPCFRRAVAINPSYLQAHHAIVATLVGLQELEEARRALTILEELAPASEEAQMARQLLGMGVGQ